MLEIIGSTLVGCAVCFALIYIFIAFSREINNSKKIK